jgi:hypothetical protein
MMSRSALSLASVLVMVATATAAAQEDPRDAKIRELEQRLDQLQQRLEKVEGRDAAPAAAPAAPPAQTQVPSQPPATQAASPTGTKYGAGEENRISDEEIGLALQSTLLQKGAALLPPWTVQLIPELDYSYQRTNALAVVTAGGTAAVASQDTRSDLLGGSLALRLGLPWQSQAEVSVPYDYARTRVALNGVTTVQETKSIGDVQVGLSKSLWKESPWLPGGLGTVTWKTATGHFFNPFGGGLQGVGGLPLSTNAQRLSPGTGFQSLTGALSLNKREDPLVFFGSLGYTHNFTGQAARVDLDAGDVIGTSFGAALAASPATSISASLNLGFAGKSKVNGITMAGTDQTIGLFELGATTVLTRRLLINGTVGFGITQGTPDFVLGLALPIQF